MTLRLRLDIAYDGTNFAGWACQPGQRTVQGEIEAALATIVRRPVPLTVAGRTDAGVHARGQVAHCDVSESEWHDLHGRAERPPGENPALLGLRLARRLTALIARGACGPRGSSDIMIHSVQVVSEHFDARFSALRRHYRYWICDQWATLAPWQRFTVWQLPAGRPLDLTAMSQAAEPLLGEHDFLSFCRPKSGGTTIRRLEQLSFTRVPADSPGAGLVRIDVTADAFCRNMVRSLTAAAVAVGRGERPQEWMAWALQECRRTVGTGIAPAHGLTLEAVDYPPADQLAARAAQTRAVRSQLQSDENNPA